MSTFPITLSLLLFIFNSQKLFSAATRILCRPDQRDALLEFKNEFEIGKPSPFCTIAHPKTLSWVNNSDCCYCDGITCDSKSGEVIKLDLSCSSVRGRFHSDSKLLKVQSLRILDLSHNNFSGQIPFSIQKLSHLTSLNVSRNSFSRCIPSSIGDIPNLTFLDLSRNKFVSKIPSSLGSLLHLTSLDLSNNSFFWRNPIFIWKSF